MNSGGWTSAQLSPVAAPVTAPQKKVPTLMPNSVPPGTSTLVVRRPSDHWIGLDHCSLKPGPIGPVFVPFSCWPQCPAYASHAYGEAGDAGMFGSGTISGSARSVALRVSSHPNPSRGPRPR